MLLPYSRVQAKLTVEGSIPGSVSSSAAPFNVLDPNITHKYEMLDMHEARVKQLPTALDSH